MEIWCLSYIIFQFFFCFEKDIVIFYCIMHFIYFLFFLSWNWLKNWVFNACITLNGWKLNVTQAASEWDTDNLFHFWLMLRKLLKQNSLANFRTNDWKTNRNYLQEMSKVSKIMLLFDVKLTLIVKDQTKKLILRRAKFEVSFCVRVLGPCRIKMRLWCHWH